MSPTKTLASSDGGAVVPRLTGEQVTVNSAINNPSPPTPVLDRAFRILELWAAEELSVAEVYDAILALHPVQPPALSGGDVGELVAVLRGYEAWEADLIANGRWEATGDGLPTLTDELYDSLMELQAHRNEALSAHHQPGGKGDE